MVEKGILLELDGQTGVVLTPQGEFRRVRVPPGTWDVGDEIEIAAPRPMAWRRWVLAAAAVVALLLLPVGYRSWVLAQPMALLTIDINPSVELTVDQRERVTAARGLNQDGSALVAAVQWKRRSVGEVVGALMEAAIATDKLDLTDETGAVVVAVAPPDGGDLPPEKAEKIGEVARAAITQALSDQGQKRNTVPRVQVPVLKVTEAEKQEAREAGLTPGQYLIMQEIRQAVPDVNPEDVKNLGIGKLLKQLHLDAGEILQRAQQHGSQSRGQHGAPAKSGAANPGWYRSGQDNSPGRSQGRGWDWSGSWERVWQNWGRGNGREQDRSRDRDRDARDDRNDRLDRKQGSNRGNQDNRGNQGNRDNGNHRDDRNGRNDRGRGQDRNGNSRGRTDRGLHSRR